MLDLILIAQRTVAVAVLGRLLDVVRANRRALLVWRDGDLNIRTHETYAPIQRALLDSHAAVICRVDRDDLRGHASTAAVLLVIDSHRFLKIVHDAALGE